MEKDRLEKGKTVMGCCQIRGKSMVSCQHCASRVTDPDIEETRFFPDCLDPDEMFIYKNDLIFLSLRLVETIHYMFTEDD